MIVEEYAWWVDSGTMRHVCKYKSLFKFIKAAHEGTVVYMGNATTGNVFGIGSIELMFTSDKKLILTNTYYVP